jgi:hypothetical protein
MWSTGDKPKKASKKIEQKMARGAHVAQPLAGL